MNRISILTIAILISIAAASSCAANRDNSRVSKAADEAAHNNSTNDKSKAENKMPENKSAETAPAKTVEIYDGREGPDGKEREIEVSKNDIDFVEKEVRPQGDAIKKLVGEENQADGSPCYEDSYRVEGVVEGAFTKTGAKQKAYLYTLCQGDGGRETFYIGGILIAENGKRIANYVFGELFGYAEIKSLPDVNQNSLSEIVLTPRTVINEGYYTSSIAIVEISAGKIVALGGAETFSNSPDTGEKDGSATGYIISAQTGKTPIFFRETYRRKSADDSWVLKKKSEKFALTKIENAEFSKGFKLFSE